MMVAKGSFRLGILYVVFTRIEEILVPIMESNRFGFGMHLNRVTLKMRRWRICHGVHIFACLGTKFGRLAPHCQVLSSL